MEKQELTSIRRKLAMISFLGSVNENENPVLLRTANCLISAIKIDETGNFFLEAISSMVDPDDEKWFNPDEETMKEVLDTISLFKNWEIGFKANNYMEAIEVMMTAMFGQPGRGRVFDVKYRTVESANQIGHQLAALLQTGHPITRKRSIGKNVEGIVSFGFQYSNLTIHRYNNRWVVEYNIKF